LDFALGAQHGKLDTDLRTLALLGTPSVQSVHGYYPFAMEDGGRLAPMTDELVDRVAIMVAVRHFRGMGDVDSRSLRSDSYVRLKHFVRRTTSIPFRRFLGGVRREFMQRLYATLLGTMVPNSATLCKRAMLTLWHAFMFLGLRFLSLFLFLLSGLYCFFL
jgi:hypothetical protein